MKKEIIGIVLSAIAVFVGLHAAGNVEDNGADFGTLVSLLTMAVLAIAAKQCFDHENEQ